MHTCLGKKEDRLANNTSESYAPTTWGWTVQCEEEGTRCLLSPDQGAEPAKNMFMQSLIAFPAALATISSYWSNQLRCLAIKVHTQTPLVVTQQE